MEIMQKDVDKEWSLSSTYQFGIIKNVDNTQLSYDGSNVSETTSGNDKSRLKLPLLFK